MSRRSPYTCGDRERREEFFGGLHQGSSPSTIRTRRLASLRKMSAKVTSARTSFDDVLRSRHRSKGFRSDDKVTGLHGPERAVLAFEL